MKPRISVDHILAILRITLGLVLIIGGYKVAFPVDPVSLGQSYIDPQAGWISGFFHDLITTHTGLTIPEFLKLQGMAEMMLGMTLILGMFTSAVGILTALIFWGFVIANPSVGEIRLSRDIALMGISIAVALGGGGVFSMDGLMFRKRAPMSTSKDPLLAAIRFSLAFTLIVSAVFTEGLFANVLNSTIPVQLVLILGALFLVGLFPRWLSLIMLVWMGYLIGDSLLSKEFYPALDGVKREIAFMGASLVYLLLGPDRWSWPVDKIRN